MSVYMYIHMNICANLNGGFFEEYAHSNGILESLAAEVRQSVVTLVLAVLRGHVTTSEGHATVRLPVHVVTHSSAQTIYPAVRRR